MPAETKSLGREITRAREPDAGIYYIISSFSPPFSSCICRSTDRRVAHLHSLKRPSSLLPVRTPSNRHTLIGTYPNCHSPAIEAVSGTSSSSYFNHKTVGTWKIACSQHELSNRNPKPLLTYGICFWTRIESVRGMYCQKFLEPSLFSSSVVLQTLKSKLAGSRSWSSS